VNVQTAADPPDHAVPDDPGAFAAWVGPSLQPMSRLARRLAPGHDPDDVVQDALTRAWQKRRQFEADRGTPTVWLLAILADQARSARRSRVRRLQVVDETADLPDRAAPHADPDVDLDRAIAMLGERQQLAVHLHYFIGLPVDETAQAMGVSPGTVKSTLFDARTRLRVLLGDDDER
jgi:RNA polymerase sigma-70 factor (ECF subfamily)